MLENYAIRLKSEMERLKKLGWDTDKYSTKTFVLPNESKSNLIHFPEEAFDSRKNGLDSDGLWEDFRFLKISEQLHLHEKQIIWEVGAGNGAVTIPLFMNGFTPIAIEPLALGAQVIEKAGIRTYVDTLDNLELPSQSIDTIGIFDVLEHIDDTKRFLEEINRVLNIGGMLILTVPAHQWLFSDFDVSIGHFRRYSKKLINEDLSGAGFKVISSRFIFSSLVIPAFFARTLPSLFGRKRTFKRVKKASKFQKELIKMISVPLSVIFNLEWWCRLPFGLSLLVVARKE